MIPAALIRAAQADGVTLTLSTSGTITATGDGAAVKRWVPTLKAHKAEILAALTAVNDAADCPPYGTEGEPAAAEARELIARLCRAWACPPGEYAELLELYRQGTLTLDYIERLIHDAPPSLTQRGNHGDEKAHPTCR